MSTVFYRFLLLGYFLFSTIFTRAQYPTNPAPAIKVIARAQKNKILLRWGITTPVAWKLANQYGYIIERYTVLRNGHTYAGQEKVVLAATGAMQRIKGNFGKDTLYKIFLTSTPLKPKPLHEWKDIIEKNDNAAILAQGIYGEDFTISKGKEDLASIMDQNDELEQRFTFSMAAAEKSFPAAQIAGLGWVDSTVKPNEKYLYRIYTAVPGSTLKIDTGSVFISPADVEALPTPKDLYATFADKSVVLSWNYKLLNDSYTAYYVERSEDGSHFKKLSGLPVVNLETEKTPGIFYTDSVEENNKTYYYRVVGVTPFEEEGPPSEVVKGKGQETFAYTPTITMTTVTDNKEIELEWQFDEKGNKLIDHFELSQAKDFNGPFKVVNNKISTTKRKLTYNKVLNQRYFTITAIDKQGKPHTSFPYLAQLIDSIPPAPPTGLTAKIDSSGKVVLQWDANKETDLLGYKVVRGNIKGEELGVITAKAFNRTSFTDKVSMKMMNGEIYYALIALDRRYNQSALSAVIKVEKPDVIPPSAPVFTNYRIEDNKVIINWVNSSSTDVVAHQLYRQDLSDKTNKEWRLQKSFSDKNTTTYTDKETVPGNTYAYMLVAMDKSKNESPSTSPLTVSMPVDVIKPAVKQLQIQVNREQKAIVVQWKYDEKGVVEYEIYKCIKGNPITLWKVVPAKQKQMMDTDVSPNNIYKYAVRATFKDGGISRWQEASVQY